MRKSEKYILLLVPFLMFVLILRYNHVMGWSQVNILFDMDQYVNYSAALVNGQGYTTCAPQYYAPCHELDSPPSAYRLPGTPLLYAGIMLISGLNDPFPSIRFIQALFSALTALLVVDYAARLFGGRAGLVAGMLMIANPAPYYFAFWLLSENLFLLLIAILLYLMTFKPNTFLIGLCVGAMLLTRGSFLFTVPLLLFFIPPRRWWVFGAAIALLLVPWIVRNAIEMNEFIPFSTGGGAVIYGANNSAAFASAPGHWINPGFLPIWETVSKMGEVAQDRYLTSEALSFLRTQDIPTLISVAVTKISRLFINNPNPYPLLPFIVLVPLIIFRRIRRPSMVRLPNHAHRPLLIMAALWIGLFLNTAIFWGDDRFRLPLDMTLAILVGMLMFGLNPQSKDWKGKRGLRKSPKLFPEGNTTSLDPSH